MASVEASGPPNTSNARAIVCGFPFHIAWAIGGKASHHSGSPSRRTSQTEASDAQPASSRPRKRRAGGHWSARRRGAYAGRPRRECRTRSPSTDRRQPARPRRPAGSAARRCPGRPASRSTAGRWPRTRRAARSARAPAAAGRSGLGRAPAAQPSHPERDPVPVEVVRKPLAKLEVALARGPVAPRRGDLGHAPAGERRLDRQLQRQLEAGRALDRDASPGTGASRA